MKRSTLDRNSNPKALRFDVAQSLRCSRPLCSSQNTGGISRAQPKPDTTRSEDRHTRNPKIPNAHGPEVRSTPPPEDDSAGPVPQDPTACKRPVEAPGSVPIFRVVNNTADVLASRFLAWSQCQCSTHERHRRSSCSERTVVSVMATSVIALYTDAYSSAP